jgi:uncharacterized protein
MSANNTCLFMVGIARLSSVIHQTNSIIMTKMNPVVHFEMPAEDKQRMAEFYSTVFGWQTSILGPEMGNYVLVNTTETDENNMIKKPGAINGGFFEKSKEPEHTRLVIAVDDIHESLKKLQAAGGTVHGEPQEIPGVGLYVVFTDTEGNESGMLQPAQM